MAALEIPILPSVPHQEFAVVLDGVEYILEIRWNDRDEAWFANLYDAERDVICYGIVLVIEYPILRRVNDPRRPAGELLLIDEENTQREAGLDDLGARVKLVYVTA
jgi:hypothetical protein